MERFETPQPAVPLWVVRSGAPLMSMVIVWPGSNTGSARTSELL